MYISTLEGLWTYSNCPIHAIRNFLGRDANEYYDFYKFLCKNHKLSDFLHVLGEIMRAEGRSEEVIVARPYRYAEFVMAKKTITHIFVIRGQHIYNITRTHILDSVKRTIRNVTSMKDLIEELRGADVAVFVVAGGTAQHETTAAKKFDMR